MYATTVTTRLAIDALRSARYRREQYVGPWLPEPLVESDDSTRRIEMDETVSVAFLVVLERLSPVERAVFLLREVFGYEYAEIASVVEKSEVNCRQLFRRARQHLRDGQTRFDLSVEDRDRLAERFFAAVRDGDLAGLEAVLADDVVLFGDGGGKAPAVRTPVRGATQVSRTVLGLARQADRRRWQQEPVHVNGHPGAQVFSASDDIIGVLSLGIRAGRVVAVYNQINPDKLRHLGIVGHVHDGRHGLT